MNFVPVTEESIDKDKYKQYPKTPLIKQNPKEGSRDEEREIRTHKKP